MLDLGAGSTCLDVDHDAHDPLHRTWHVDLLRAEQGHVLHPKQPRAEGWKFRPDVRRDGEDHADQLVGGELVAVKDRLEQRGHRAEQLVPLVAVDADGTPDRAYRHGDHTNRQPGLEPPRPIPETFGGWRSETDEGVEGAQFVAGERTQLPWP